MVQSIDPMLSFHATQRQAQRGIPDAHVAYVMQHGAVMRRTGVTFRILRRCDIPPADRRDEAYARLEGTVVLLGDRDRVITVYRNRDAYREVKKLAKRRSA